jgi:hypothetical protein
MTSCREISVWVDTLVDGELPLDHAVDAECHVAQCPSCAERVRFERAFRSSVRHAVQNQSQPSLALQQRLERMMIAERTSSRVYACTPLSSVIDASFSQEHIQSRGRHVGFSIKNHGRRRPIATDVVSSSWGALNWRSLLPVAAVAAGAILWAGFQNQHPIPLRETASDLRLSELDSYLDVMVNQHRGSPPQAQSIRFSHEEMLDPPYQLPPFQDVRGLEGQPLSIRIPATNVSLSALRGASSAYQVRGHRVTFFAYETAAAPLRARLEGHSLRGHVVYVGKRHGYSVATVEEGPVGYAMTSDLPPLESADLIASAIDAPVHH